MFKQFLQANALDYVQVDACRLGGLNEVMAVMLMAAKFRVPLHPVGYIQRLSKTGLALGSSLNTNANTLRGFLAYWWCLPSRILPTRHHNRLPCG